MPLRINILQTSYLLLLAGVIGCTTALKLTKPTAATEQTAEVDTARTRFSGGDFDEHIRKSDPRTPEAEQAGFVLPPGFEINLFASEPLIGKPLNMAFDAKGRLWVSQSGEYPFAAKAGKGTDRILILEDRNHDGKADSGTTVLDTLNIPIGLLPTHDGLLAFSIPNLYRFTDTNGDDKPDQRQKLLGPFGYTDTHGMVNHITRGFDGWIQACHGFTNLSKVPGADGDTAKLESGSTFRFRMDGSRAELVTKGRVNPFGLVYDRWGYLYSPDSHSSPLTQLIRGAEYPHFGRISESIGFAPAMKPHEREATALAGIALPSSPFFPETYRNSFYVGDVVKCRIYRNSFTFNGSSPVAKNEGELMRSDDPWFRPVDIVEGPDGALYVADFYNRIIGHYEVPLDNPGRDRQRGRIWRITYKGKVDKLGYTDWTKAPVAELINALAKGNLPVRMLAMDQLVNRVGPPAVGALLAVSVRKNTPPDQYVHSMWALNQLKALPKALLMNALHHKQALIRTHAMRVVHESPGRSDTLLAEARLGLADPSPHVRRAAVEALTDYPRLETIRALLDYQPTIDSLDTHLTYTVRLALRTLLRNKLLGQEVASASWATEQRQALAGPMSGVNEAYAAQFLFQTVQRLPLTKADELTYLGHAARFLTDTERDDLVQFVRDKYDADKNGQFTLFKSVQQAIKKQGSVVNESVKAWAVVLAKQLLDSPRLDGPRPDWTFRLAEPTYLKDNPVSLTPPPQNMAFAKDQKFLGFDLGGYKGVVRSPAFMAPKQLAFSVVSFNAVRSSGPKHLVRLVSATDTTHQLACTELARADEYRADEVTWGLAAHEGERVYLELVDLTPGIVRITNVRGTATPILPMVSPKELDEQKRFALELVGDFGITTLEPLLQATLPNQSLPYYFRLASAKSLMKLAPVRYANLLSSYIEDEQQPVPFRIQLATILGDTPRPEIEAVMESALKRTHGEVQLELLKSLASSAMGKDLIMAQVTTGTLYTRMLVQPGIQDRLLLNISQPQKARYDQLTANLSPIDEAREVLITSRLASFSASGGIADNGRQVFATHCATCHQINREGGLIGPQLDGIGSWGSKALATKILDPNRNISEAFRMYTIRLKSGEVRTALFRRDDAQSITYADVMGTEFVVPRNDIADSQPSRHTLMPNQFGTVLNEQEFNDLLSYLLKVK
ncbi:PVC-type heme-binding CxxCH protein [Fibrella aquatilis]|uniref:C-type cytochrome n=1 Tax=Fibrella aquatilis TaxID=2817059 RepID=A0A939G4C4_9BACT|nr:PVC-type heme-binding CxxCH protein [Fibrella aquatilis]MBO0931651.1 c-type cytochrome [Fibrella aquatilis]